jgi:hypothetical protein
VFGIPKKKLPIVANPQETNKALEFMAVNPRPSKHGRFHLCSASFK